MRLLVTGGTGFIGSHLAMEGRRRGAEVVVLGLDRPSRGAGQRRAAAVGRASRFCRAASPMPSCAHRAMRGATHVFHLAVAMREGASSDEFFERVNLDGTRRLLEASRDRRGRAIRVLQHDRHLWPPGARDHAARTRRSRPATSTSGPRSRRSELVRAVRRTREPGVRDPPAGRRVRATRPAAAEAVQRACAQGRFPLFGTRRRAPPHGLRGRCRLRVLQGVRAERGGGRAA